MCVCFEEQPRCASSRATEGARSAGQVLADGVCIPVEDDDGCPAADGGLPSARGRRRPRLTGICERHVRGQLRPPKSTASLPSSASRPTSARRRLVLPGRPGGLAAPLKSCARWKTRGRVSGEQRRDPGDRAAERGQCGGAALNGQRIPPPSTTSRSSTASWRRSAAPSPPYVGVSDRQGDAIAAASVSAAARSTTRFQRLGVARVLSCLVDPCLRSVCGSARARLRQGRRHRCRRRHAHLRRRRRGLSTRSTRLEADKPSSTACYVGRREGVPRAGRQDAAFAGGRWPAAMPSETAKGAREG